MSKKDYKAPYQAIGTELINNYNALSEFKLFDNRHDKPIFRMFQCMQCNESFKRSQGVLFISGFYCHKDNPANWSVV